ncbi:MAG: HK97 family phage prohead protease [Candidatus Acidiferrales bacterium]
MDLERRISTVAFACRAAKDGSEKVVEGMAARYNRLSQPLPNPNGCGTFRERILPGAFKGCMGQDTVMLQDHDPSRILGRTKSGTLKLADTAQGLQFRCVLPNNQTGNDLHESVRRGDINSCSFSFGMGERGDKFDEMDEEDFDENGEERVAKKKSGKQMIVRSLINIDKLHDVSVVTYPAYPNGTSVSARSMALPAVIVPTQKQIDDSTRRFEEDITVTSFAARRKNLLAAILS